MLGVQCLIARLRLPSEAYAFDLAMLIWGCHRNRLSIKTPRSLSQVDSSRMCFKLFSSSIINLGWRFCRSTSQFGFKIGPHEKASFGSYRLDVPNTMNLHFFSLKHIFHLSAQFTRESRIFWSVSRSIKSLLIEINL